MELVDYKTQLKKFYKPASNNIEWVDVPSMNFIMIDGWGVPAGSPEYANAVEILFTIALAVKLIVKKTEAIDYSIMPLESLWTAGGPSLGHRDQKTDGNWTLMIQQPTPVTTKIVAKAITETRLNPLLLIPPTLRFEALNEGLAAQALHLGPLEGNEQVLKSIHDRIHSIHGKPSGKYHEIYLSDTRKAKPEKWKTIFRQPYL
jgi:hypothetical protein